MCQGKTHPRAGQKETLRKEFEFDPDIAGCCCYLLLALTICCLHWLLQTHVSPQDPKWVANWETRLRDPISGCAKRGWLKDNWGISDQSAQTGLSKGPKQGFVHPTWSMKEFGSFFDTFLTLFVTPIQTRFGVWELGGGNRARFTASPGRGPSRRCELEGWGVEKRLEGPDLNCFPLKLVHNNFFFEKMVVTQIWTKPPHNTISGGVA